MTSDHEKSHRRVQPKKENPDVTKVPGPGPKGLTDKENKKSRKEGLKYDSMEIEKKWLEKTF